MLGLYSIAYSHTCAYPYVLSIYAYYITLIHMYAFAINFKLASFDNNCSESLDFTCT